MLVTVTNLSSTATVDLPMPFNVLALAASGTSTKPVTLESFLDRDATGNPYWRQWDDLIKKGLISLTTVGEGGKQSSVLALLQLGQPTRMMLGPWIQANVAANQAAVALGVGATAAPQVDLIPTRPGSVVGIGASFSVAPAGTDLTLTLLKNGVAVAACLLTVAAGATLGRSVVFAADLHRFVAGDRLGIAVTTGAGWTATTSDVAVTIEIEG